MILREFNSQGIEAFRRFLADARQNPQMPLPNALLDDDALAQVVNPLIDVPAQNFATRREATAYLHSILEPLPKRRIVESAGLWSWLTAFFFDEVCPMREGKRVVRNDYHYLFEPKNPRHFYRHLLFVAWHAREIAPSHNRLFLNGPVWRLDKATEEVMKRLYITRIRCIFEVLDHLYWDERRGRIRSGVLSPGRVQPGDLLHRFFIRIRQLEMTYDLQSLNADQLIELLGDEFQHNRATVATMTRSDHRKSQKL